MYFKRFKQKTGLYGAVVLVLVGLILPVAASMWQPPAVDAAGQFPDPGEGAWFYKPEACKQSGGGTAAAALYYTDPNTKKTAVFNCEYILTRADQDFIALSGPNDCSGNPEVIFVGRRIEQAGAGAVGTSYHKTKVGKLSAYTSNSSGKCSNQTVLPTLQQFNLTNTYDENSSQPSVGTAYWSKIDPLNPVGVLNASFTLGSFTKASEIFTQSSINGTVMTLTGNKSGQGCGSSYLDFIQVGTIGTSKNYWEDTVGTITTYVPGGDELSSTKCQPVEGLVSLIDQTTGKPASYIDAGGTAPTSTTDAGNGCPFDPNGLNFLLCGLWGLISVTAQKVADNMTATLYVNASSDPSGGGVFGTSFKAAFDSFRNIALTIVILVGLVMVISQAAGLEIFSAYSIKKRMVPMVLAVIGISLAWPIMQLVVPFFNDLGTWTQSIIQGAIAPVQGAQAGADLGLLGILFSVAGVNAFVGLGAAGMLSLGLAVLVALLVAFVTLILRQIIIVLCIMLAPIAIAFSVFPGTEGLFKFWRKTFIDMLVLFPAIMGLLAAGGAVSRVAQAEAQQPGGGFVTNGWVFLTIAVVAKYLPYLMLPAVIGATNRTMSGIQNALRGFANNRLKGTYDRLAKVQQANKEFKHQERMAGTKRAPGGDLYRRFFTPGGLARTRAGWAAGGNKVLKNKQLLAQKIAEDDKGFIGYDDDALFVAAQGYVGGDYIREYNRRTGSTGGAQALARINGTFGQAGLRGTRLATAKALMNSSSMLTVRPGDDVGNSNRLREVYSMIAGLQRDGVVSGQDGANLVKSAKRMDVGQVSQGNAEAAITAAGGGTWNMATYQGLLNESVMRVEAGQLVHQPPQAITHIGERLAAQIAAGGPSQAAYIAQAEKLYTDLSSASISGAQALQAALGPQWATVVANSGTLAVQQQRGGTAPPIF